MGLAKESFQFDAQPAGASVASHLIIINLEQGLLETLLPIEVTLSGIVMLVKITQDLKAEFPTEVTLSGIVMLVKA